MAMVMMVSACVTPVLAAFNTETHREHIEEIVNDPELQAKYEEIKATVEYVAKDIEENYEEYYAEGYAYADENGYIEAAIEAIKLALEVLPEIDLEEVGMTEELREKLQAEIDVLPGTLEKLVAILESGEASEFNGFVNAALTLEGDLYLHMNNIYAILEQGSIDLNQIYLVPAFNEGMKILNEQVLPAIDAAVEAFVEGVVNHVVEKLTPYYNAVVSALGIAYDTYVKLVETIVKIYVFVGNTRGVKREFVGWCEENQIPLRIWGEPNGWKKQLKKDTCIQLEGILDNQELPELYRKSKIIFNDHFEDMRNNGFMNNRLFEVLGCGRPLISDYGTYYEKVFGDSILFYRDEQEFLEKVKYLEENYEKQQAKVMAIIPRLKEEFSFAKRAKDLKNAVDNMK